MTGPRLAFARLLSARYRAGLAKAWQRTQTLALGVLKIFPAVLLVALVYQYFNERIVIQPLSVTKTLSEAGVTDVVAADELRHRIYAIFKNASLDNRAAKGVAVAPELPDITVPATGISVNTLFDLVAEVFPFSPRTVVSGAFTDDSGQLRLEVYVDKQQVYSSTPGRRSRTPDELLDDAANAVVVKARPLAHVSDLLRKRQRGDAYTFLTGIIHRPPLENKSTAEAYEALGVVYMSENKLEYACAQFGNALKHDPYSADTYQSLSVLLSQEGALHQATLEAAKAVLLTGGRNSRSYYNLGNRYYALAAEQAENGEHATDASADTASYWKASEDAYARAISIEPELAYVHEALGKVYRQENKLAEAFSEFQSAIALDASSAEAIDDVGELLMRPPSNDLRLAKSEFLEASKADPSMGKPHDDLGAVYFANQQYDRATAEFLRAVRLNPSDRFALQYLKTSWLASSGNKNRCGSQGRIGGANDVLFREVASIECTSTRPLVATGKSLPPVCAADPPDTSPLFVATTIEMLPARASFCWLTFVEWVKEHIRAIGFVAAVTWLALFIWRARRRALARASP
jgi:tetratricopeptide (TPR) repeat protein